MPLSRLRTLKVGPSSLGNGRHERNGFVSAATESREWQNESITESVRFIDNGSLSSMMSGRAGILFQT